MFFLEPLVEVETPAGRVAYGAVSARDVTSLFDAGFLQGGAHALRIGRPEDHPYLKRQTRLTFARCGITDPVSIEDYAAHEGWLGLKRAIEIGSTAIVEEITKSGLRGRGGAGFPTGIKWKTVADTKADRKYVVCNCDEGDSGTFADRMVLEDDPYMLIEGMTICAIAVGATKGYVYCRSEYPHGIKAFNEALVHARAAGYLGPDILGSGHAFDIELRVGAAPMCAARKPPCSKALKAVAAWCAPSRHCPPSTACSRSRPSSTTCSRLRPRRSFSRMGRKPTPISAWGRSRGTMPLQIAGNVRYGGLFETAFGLTLGEIVEDIGGGTLSGRPVRAVQCGGPLGAYFPTSLFDTPFDYEAFAAKDGLIGHGGLVVFDDTVDMMVMARFAMNSAPSRVAASVRPAVSARPAAGSDRRHFCCTHVEANLRLLEDLCQTMKFGSLCALGGFAPYRVLSAMRHYPEDFRSRVAATAAE